MTDLPDAIGQISAYLLRTGVSLITAGSCTGGALASAFTSQPGSSAWFEGSFVTYRLSAKTRMLGIGAAELEKYGAVSEHIVRLMAQQALTHSDARMSIAISGLAGPDDDGTSAKLGTLWIAWARQADNSTLDWLASQSFELHTSREIFRRKAVVLAIEGLVQRLVDSH